MSVVKWNISEPTLAQYETLDQAALSKYTSIYESYYKANIIDIDCLGVLKYFYCA